ncbi:MAG: OB-fold domain-containing protein [Acidimicrobiia bacterium]|nr:OB-fold domain-containing protein [Acidimicrobiia bacterium]
MPGRPLPVADDLSASFWAAAAEHRLVIARCFRCNELTHPPDLVCPHCHHTDPQFRFEPVSGSGTVCSWTVLHQSFLPGFDDDLPLLLVDVRLDEGDVRLIGRLLGGADAALRAGSRVTVTFEDLAPGVAIPAFALVPEA